MKVNRALEGVVCNFPSNTADNPILKITMSQKNTNGQLEHLNNHIKVLKRNAWATLFFRA